MKKLILVTLIVIGAAACKNKKPVVAENNYIPERDDYIMAASYSYILICDSASKKTSKYMMDTAYKISYGQNETTIFKLNESLGNNNFNKRMQAQIKEILAGIMGDLTPTTASYIRFKKDDYPDDFLRRNILVSRFLEPNFDILQNHILLKLEEKWKTAVTYRLWTDANMLYNQYYNSNKKVEIDFSNISQNATNQYIETAKKYEPFVKDSFAYWDNKNAASIMAAIKR